MSHRQAVLLNSASELTRRESEQAVSLVVLVFVTTTWLIYADPLERFWEGDDESETIEIAVEFALNSEEMRAVS